MHDRRTPLVVYVIDDDTSVRKALARLITSAGLPVCSFDSGEAFLSATQPTASDCLVLDVQMPGMSGLEVQQRLAQAGWWVPIIFLTSLDDERDREQARRTGAVAYFSKPMDGQALLDMIVFVLGRPIC